MVEELSQDYSVKELCAVLEVTRSGYYAWLNGQETARQIANHLLVQQIRRVYREKKGRYGSPRVTQQLRREGQRCNHKRVERLMRQHGLKGCSSCKRRTHTTDSNHDQPIAPNLLLGRAAPGRPNEVWVSDITYVPTAEGWLFLAAVMDLYSRQILGWSVWESLEAGGALQALKRALANRDHPTGVIHHSDRGIQYACHAYREQLKAADLAPSMSRRGNCAMTTPPWRPSGALSNARPWLRASVGRRTEFGANSSNISKPFTTGAGSTALWGINHLWTSKTKTVNSEKTQVHSVHEKGGRE